MIVTMSLTIVGVHLSLNITGTMASKRTRSKGTVGSETGDGVEQVSMGLPIYEETKLVINKEIKMKAETVNGFSFLFYKSVL